MAYYDFLIKIVLPNVCINISVISQARLILWVGSHDQGSLRRIPF